jgi:uncharacterized protein YdiU (UPF0061 family)
MVQKPVAVRDPNIVIFNDRLAEELSFHSASFSAELLAGNVLASGAQPIAQAYMGHQFGHANMLGDGRAVLLGEHVHRDGRRFDIQLKGSGRTPFSRGGDGRAALGPMLREYIISEAMAGLGIPTTRSLAVVTTGETVQRETMLPGAILTRIAASHIRVGTFEYAARLGELDLLRQLADYTMVRHYPELVPGDYHGFFAAVLERQAALVARWMLVGFIHGVMNTDNMAISGETIDYGPCAFMDQYAPETVFSSIDHFGRYAYVNQPPIAQWNLARFAETLLPLLHSDQQQAIDQAQEMLASFPARYEQHWLAGMRKKLGLLNEEAEDQNLAENLLALLHQEKADYTYSFRHLADLRNGAFAAWHATWQARLQRQPLRSDEVNGCMQQHNPSIIPRNQWVEQVLAAAAQENFAPLNELVELLRTPYANHSEVETPPESCGPYQTFCGT